MRKIEILYRIILSVAFVSYSLLPQQFAFALLEDCGPHEYAVCGEHKDSHVILVHAHETQNTYAESFNLNDINSTHDSSHQITDRNLLSIAPAFQISEYASSIDVISMTSGFMLPRQNGYKHKYFSLDPPGQNQSLISLKITRLLI